MSDREQNDEVRREMLAAIRRHLTTSAPFDAVRREKPAAAAHEAGGGGRALAARTTAPVLPDDGERPRQAEGAAIVTPPLIDLFQQSLEAVAGHCLHVHDEREAAAALRQIIAQTQARRIAVSDAPLVRRIVELSGPDREPLASAAVSELFECDLGITGAQWAVAETGTLVLDSESERHRLTSLVPAAHLAIITADRIRATLAEVLHAISTQGTQNLSRSMTFITGPSRTSDIELTLAIGVHGPGELFVIIIDESGDHA